MEVDRDEDRVGSSQANEVPSSYACSEVLRLAGRPYPRTCEVHGLTGCPSVGETSAVMFRIVNTCNFGKDYPDERFLNCPSMSEDEAKTVADILNRREGSNALRYWKVVESSYELAPAFQP